MTRFCYHQYVHFTRKAADFDKNQSAAFPDIYIFGIPFYGLRKYAAFQSAILDTTNSNSTLSPFRSPSNSPFQAQGYPVTTTTTSAPVTNQLPQTIGQPGVSQPSAGQPVTGQPSSQPVTVLQGGGQTSVSNQSGSTQITNQQQQAAAAQSATQGAQEVQDELKDFSNFVMTAAGPVAVNEQDEAYKNIIKYYTEPQDVDSKYLAPGVPVDVPPNKAPQLHVIDNVRNRYDGAVLLDQFMTEQDPQKKSELFQKLPQDLKASLTWLTSINWKDAANFQDEAMKVLDNPEAKKHFQTLWSYGLANIATKGPDGRRLDINNEQDREQVVKNAASVISRAFADDNEITIQDLNLLYNNFTRQLGLDPQDPKSAQVFNSMRETKQLTPFHNMALLFGLPIVLGSIASILSGNIGILPVLGLMFGGILSLFGAGSFEQSANAQQAIQEQINPILAINIGDVGNVPFIPTALHRGQLDIARQRALARQAWLQEASQISPEEFLNKTYGGQRIGDYKLNDIVALLRNTAANVQQGQPLDPEFVKILNSSIFVLQQQSNNRILSYLDVLNSEQSPPEKKAEALSNLANELQKVIDEKSGLVNVGNYTISTVYSYLSKNK